MREFDQDHGFYYGFLIEDAQKCYDEMLANIREYKEEFDLTPITEAEYLKANRALLDDHPELWWADTPARYSYKFGHRVYHHHFLELKGNEKETTALIEEKAKEILDEASALQNEWQKALLFHDRIVRMTKFNAGADTDGFNDQNMSSVFLGGISVCAGYSRALQYLCQNAGIDCIYVTGPAFKNRRTIKHAWNMAKIRGQWTWIDSTWDDLQQQDGSETVEHDYFCVNDEWISKDHQIPDALATGRRNLNIKIRFPKADSLEQEYHRTAGTFFPVYDPDAVNESITKQGNRVRLRFGSPLELRKAVEDIVYKNDLLNHPDYVLSKDDDSCVLRMDIKTAEI